MKLITFLTDFGSESGYSAQMKGVVHSICQDVCCVDISHQVSPHQVKQGAFLLRSIVPYFPRGTVHVGVVDPGVGSQRKAIVLATRRHIFVGPDNGLLMPAARLFGDIAAYEIKNQALLKHPVSQTFHGRDMFAPVAAHIMNGVPFDQIGPRIDINELVDLSFQKPSISDDVMMASVLYIDHFGNIITNVSTMQMHRFASVGDEFNLRMKEQQLSIPFVSSYADVDPGKLLALMGSSGFLEISMNQGNAADTFHVGSDDLLRIQKIKKTDSFEFDDISDDEIQDF